MTNEAQTEAKQLPAAGIVVDPDAKINIEYLSTKGGALTVDQTVFKGGIDMVILEGAANRSFFAGAYVEGVETFPDCFSVGNVIPSKNSPNPQSSDCASCPNAAWVGKKAPACKERRKLIGLRVITDDKGRRINPTLSVVNVPPTSVSGTAAHPGGWKGYLSKINLGQGKTKDAVVTHVALESNAPKMGYRMEFTNVGDLAELNLHEGVVAGFKAMAAAEAKFEPKPKDDTDAEVEAKAAEAAAPKPSGKGKKF